MAFDLGAAESERRLREVRRVVGYFKFESPTTRARDNCPFINQDCEGLSGLDKEDYEVCTTYGLYQRCLDFQRKIRGEEIRA